MEIERGEKHLSAIRGLPEKLPLGGTLPNQIIRYDEEIGAFLKSDTQKVLLINGRWGTGKTYFWKRLISEKSAAIKERHYSYVSLFGAKSVADIKSLIIFGGKTLQTPESLAERYAGVITWIASKKKYFNDLKIPWVGGIGSLLPSVEELLIKEYLVCFDDLERRNRSLDLEQLLGLVSVLKEQNNSRVVIICNEEELSSRDRQTLNKYREKIVDRQIAYAPSLEANLDIIFREDDDVTREVFRALELNNIRVFQQASWCLEYFQQHVKGCHPAFVRQFTQQCVKLASVHYAFGKLLTFEQVKSLPWLSGLFSDEYSLPAESSRLLEQLRFSPSRADEFIISYLKDGYCDLTGLQQVIKTLNEEFQRSVAMAEREKVWSLVRDGFRADTSEVVAAVKLCVEQNIPYLQFDYVKPLLDLAKEIDSSFEVKATQLAEASALQSARTTDDLPVLKLIDESFQSGPVKEAVALRRIEIKPQRSIGDLISALADSQGWNPQDYTLLNQYSEDEIVEWLTSAEDNRLLPLLARVMARARHDSGGEDKLSAAKKLTNAVRGLAKRSLLDKWRAEKLVFKPLKDRLKELGIDDDIPPRPIGDEQPISPIVNL